MKTNEVLQRQQSALREVQRLTSQLESGEIGKSDGVARIESVMETLEAQTTTYQRQRRLAWAMPRILWRLAAFVLFVLAFIAMLYVQQIV